MSFDYQIEVDATKSLSTLKDVDAANVAIEASGKRAGEAISGAFSKPTIKDAAGNFSALGLAASKTTANAVGLTEQWKAEEAMLSKMLAPMKEYESSLKSLDGLLERNAISTREYADEVTKLNRKIGEKPEAGHGEGGGEHEGGHGVEIEGSFGKAAAGQLGEVGGIGHALITGGAIEAAALAGVAAEVVNLGNEYITLSNSALRLAGTQDKVDETLSQQLSLSKDLHGNLEETMELSTIVNERTEDLNLTTREQTDLTRELGQASQLSGHSVGDAAGIMERLGFAFESGIPAGKMLKSVMIEFPAIAELMKTHFHATTAELIAMGNKGQISMEDFRAALDGAGNDLQEKFSRRAETAGQMWGHFKDELVLTIGKLVENSGVIKAIGEAISSLAGVLGFAAKAFGYVKDAIGAVDGALDGLKEKAGAAGFAGTVLSKGWEYTTHPLHAVTDALDEVKLAGGSLSEGLQNGLLVVQNDLMEKTHKETESLITQLDAIHNDMIAHNELADSINRVAEALAGGDKLFDESNSKITDAAKKMDSYRAAVDRVQQKIASFPKGTPLKNILTQGDVDLIHGYQDAQEHFIDQSRVGGTVLEDIHKKESERSRGIEDLNRLLKDGAITQHEYNEEMKKYLEHVAALPKKPPILFGSEIERKFINEHGGDYGADRGEGLDFNAKDVSEIKAPEEDKYTKRALELSKVLDPLTAYKAELEEIETIEQMGNVRGDVTDAMLKGLHDKYDDARSAAQKYGDELALVDAKEAAGIYTTAEHIQKIAELNEKSAQFKTPAEQYVAGMLKIREAEVSGLSSTEAIDEAMRKLRMQSGMGTWADGVADGFDKIKASVGDTASIISKAMVGAFDEVNSALTELVTTGTVDVAAMGKAFEKIAVEASLKTIESSLFSKPADHAGAIATGTTTGQSAVTVMQGAAVGIGASIGEAARIAMGGGAGGVNLGGLGGLAGSSGDAAAGVDMGDTALALPGDAAGTSYRVRGHGGTDQSLQAFWATNGEQVTVSTGAQQMGGPGDSQSQQMQQQAPGVTIVNGIDDRALLSGVRSREGDREVINSIGRNRGAIMSQLRRR